ncbi:DUF6796 family protein [Ruminococcus sp. NK3A76]|uniref:DUF6796 family protein n=1 Tax=Ruminococcus sp. NK3A76 TaxID=877411 RepID=UPI00048F63AC|nr:DUF6796 family protein [Ruminococcus sp. NK3A76]
MYLLFSALGLIGGLLCCTGDILFDLKGKGNEKLGTSKNIDSNWLKMADWRFGLSIALALIGDALVGLGFYSIGMQIAETHSSLGYLTIGFGYFGAMAGIFIHAFLCVQALIYKGAMIHGDLQIADDILEKIYKQIMPTFLLGYATLLVPTVLVIIAILNGALDVPKICVLLNPIVFLIIGTTCRKIDPVKFQDLPGIIMPSFGLSMFGVIGILNLI